MFAPARFLFLGPLLTILRQTTHQQNTMSNISTGEIPFDVPTAEKACTTWYKIIGDLNSSNVPLITLHGGPGAGHDYFAPFEDLYEKYNIPVIMYDQIGCGRSTHFREKMGDTSFWTTDLFIRELDNLIDHFGLRSKGFYLYGQSWGGMLGGTYAATQPVGLKKLVLSSAPASMKIYMEGTKALLKELPQDVQRALEECDRIGDHESEKWEKASMEFYTRFVCRLNPWPAQLIEGFGNLKDDPTAYLTM
jgi:proline-specific peptidase